jgi:hypothetical protein
LKIVQWLMTICLFTASWDIVGVLHVGGTLRISQIMMIVICMIAMARMVQTGRILWPRGGTAISIWVFGQILMLPLSDNPLLAAQLLALLIFAIVGTFAFVQLYGDSALVDDLMKIYMLSFVFVGAFGLLQSFLPMIGGPPILSRSWIVHGRFARINGFSYEPSYFATYMVMGWIMLVDLRLTGARIARGRFWKWATIVLFFSLLLCTSKAGWLMMLLEGLARLIPILVRGRRNATAQLRQGQLRVPVPSTQKILTIAAATLFAFAALSFLFSKVNPLLFLSGTGLGGTAAHSYNDRTGRTGETLQVFLDHPWIGPSMGGVPELIATQHGVLVTDVDTMRLYWGGPVPLDVLAGSGIIFFTAFAIFVYINTFGALRRARQHWDDERGKWLHALGRSMIFEWIILFGDQNLVRVYLWYHFAIIMTVAYALEYAPRRVTAPALSTQGLQQAGATL